MAVHAVAVPRLLADQITHLCVADLCITWLHDIARLAVADALVFPADLLPVVRKTHPGAIEAAVVIVFGPAEFIPVSLVQGASDYLRDPWTAEEFLARLRHRLVPGVSGLDGHEVDSLTIPERRLLRILMRYADEIVPRDVLYYGLWGRSGGRSRTVDVHISALRKKLDGKMIAGVRYTIRSARGEGYRLTQE